MSRKPVIARRQFLRGSGGVTLALPFLPSLTSRAFGQAASPPGIRRFVAITTEHGAVSMANAYPADATLTRTMDLYSGHTIRYGAIAPTASGANTVVSPMLTAPTNIFSSKLASKMNVVHGFDSHFGNGHQTGVHLGNFKESQTGGPLPARPTIDQVMAWSPSFYKSLNGIKQRSVVAGQPQVTVSYGYSNPSQKSGAVQPTPANSSTVDLFNKLIKGAGSTAMQTPKRPLIIDTLKDSYSELRNSNRRLSMDDKLRLDAHVSRLDELERQLTTMGAVGAGCVANPVAPAEMNGLLGGGVDARDIDGAKYFPALNNLIAMAFACDTTRVIVLPVVCVFVPYKSVGADWHNDIAHNFTNTQKQGMIAAALQQTFQYVFADLAAKLDAIDDGGGKTILDNSLMQWSQEAGFVTHNPQGMPIITFGSAGGYYKTGNYVDYRRRISNATWNNGSGTAEYLGLAYRQWLGNALKAMGVPPSEFDPTNVGGYGDPSVDKFWAPMITPQVLSMAGSPLPIING